MRLRGESYTVKIVSFSGIACLVGVLILAPYLVWAQATISLNPSVTYQRIIGWEGTDTVGEIDLPNEFMKWRDTALDRLVNELGITRVRLEVNAGLENPVDYFAQYLNGQINYTTWMTHWFQAINDNNDPGLINPGGFQFSMLDFKIDNVILPLKQLLAARGEKLFVNLEYITGDARAGGPAPLHSGNPNEYAEFILALFKHMQTKYGWVPDQVEICNEPTVGRGWSASILGNNLLATANLLNANGLNPDFSGPSNADVGGAINWFNQLRQAVPGVLNCMTEFSFHRYGGDWLSNIQTIGTFPSLYGVRTAMLEKFDGGGTYLALHEDLKHGQVSAWQQYALAYPTDDNGAQYYWIDRSNPASPKVNMGARTRFLRQYFHFVRPGAQRIDAASDNSAFDPLAFVNRDGGNVVVIRADAAGSIAVGGLPAAMYAASYTTNGEYNVTASGKAVAAGQTLSVSIPAAGVITIYPTGQAPPAVPDYSYLPQVGNGSNAEMRLRTEMVFINTGNDTPFTVDFLDSSGQPMSLPLVQFGTRTRLTLSLRKGESISIATFGTGDLQIGYARVQTGSAVRGTAVFTRMDASGTVLYEAGVPAVSPSGDFTVYLDSLQNKDTGLALVNSSTQTTAHVRLRLYDSEFQQKGETAFDLPSGSHRANFIWEFFQGVPSLMQLAEESQGIVTVESDQPLAAVTLRQNGDPAKSFPLTVPTLTAFPVAVGRTGSPTATPNASITFFFPQIGHGRDSLLELDTEMIFMNTGTTDNQVNLDLFDSSGQPMTLALDGIGTNSSFQFSLQAGRATRLVTQGNTGLQVGYAKVTTTQAVQGTAVFTRRDSPSGIVLYEAGVPATVTRNEFSICLDSTGNRDTGLALVNSSRTTSANVLVRLYNLELQKVAEMPMLLPPGTHHASFIWEIFGNLPEVVEQAREMQGVVAVTSDLPLAAVTIRQNDDPLSDFPLSVPTLAIFPVAPGVGLTN